MGDLLGKDGVADAAKEYTEKYDLYGILANTRNADGSRRREVGLLAKDGSLVAKAAEFLTSYESGLLQLEGLDGLGAGVIPNFKGFKQNNLSASRKQVAPGCMAF